MNSLHDFLNQRYYDLLYHLLVELVLTLEAAALRIVLAEKAVGVARLVVDAEESPDVLAVLVGKVLELLPLNLVLVLYDVAGEFTQMRLNPCIWCAYMPPIDVPTMMSGCSCSQSSRRYGSASSGSTGMSGAIISSFGIKRRSVSTVPLAPDDPKP